MMQNRSMMGLVMTPKPKSSVTCVISAMLSTLLRSVMICCPTSPILVP